MSFKFKVETWISYTKPINFLMYDFYFFVIWALSNKFHSVLLQTIPPKYFPNVMVHLCQKQLNGVTGHMGFLKHPVPQTICIENTQPSFIPKVTIPPKENDSLSLPRTDSFKPIMVDQGFVWTSYQLPKMTWSNDGP